MVDTCQSYVRSHSTSLVFCDHELNALFLQVDYAAFDPIFWLHHTNIDRLFAIWQTIYPNSWMDSQTINFGNAVLQPGQTVDQNTPLKPFRQDSGGNFWTSDSARYTATFGYNYPETSDGTPSSAKAAVNALYGPSSGKNLTQKRGIHPRHNKHSNPSPTYNTSLPILSATASAATSNTPVAAAVAAGIAPNAAPASDVATAPKALAAGYYREWITNLRVQKTALQSAFFIHIFLGDFAPAPSCWTFEPNLVGSHAVFTPFTNTTTALSSGASSIVTGTIPLTRTLQAQADAGKVDLGDCEGVQAYLRRNLHWRVTRMDDSEVPSGEVRDLKVSVVSSVVKAAEAADEFPVWGDFVVHTGVTDGRSGGLCVGEAA